MNKTVLLDTDIVINLLRKQQHSIDRLLSLKQQGYALFICPIVVAEVYAGAFAKELPSIEQFFRFCQSITIDNQIARIAGQYANQFRKSHHTISLEDYLIAACAKHHALVLWTNNRKHYPMPDIELLEDTHV